MSDANDYKLLRSLVCSCRMDDCPRRQVVDKVEFSNKAEVERLEADIDIIERALDETNYPPGTQLWIDGHAAVARLAQALGIERVTT